MSGPSSSPAKAGAQTRGALITRLPARTGPLPPQGYKNGNGQALLLLCGDERGEIDDPAPGRLQLSRARHGDDAVDRLVRRSRGRGDDRLAHRIVRAGAYV